MPGPENFAAFQDYLGLNQGAADDMRSQVDASYTGPREEQLATLEQNHVNDAGAFGSASQTVDDSAHGTSPYSRAGAQYAQSGEAVRKGVASYSEFLSGMSDPAKRQALMEKTYGKGAVSALDTALTGGVDNRAQVNALKTGAESMDQRAESKLSTTRDFKTQQDASDAQGNARRQAVYDAAMRARADKAKARELTRWNMAQRGASETENGRNVVGAYSAREAAGYGGHFSTPKGTPNPGQAYQQWLTQRQQNPDYAAYNTEMQGRKTAQEEAAAQPFSITNPSTW